MPYLTVNSHKIHYVDSWDPKEKLTALKLSILLIHGLGSSQNYYYPLLRPSLNQYRCIALDTYGAGRSPYDGQEHSVATIAADVLGVMDALDIQKAVIVGHSMGGIVVTYLAATAPERVLGGVAIGPVHPNSGVAAIFEARIRMVEEDGMEGLADIVPFAATSPQASALSRAFIRELLLQNTPAGYIANCKVIANAKPPNYKAVKAPFLLIAGEHDTSAPLEGCKHIFTSVRSAKKKMEVLQNVGHWHCVEAPERVGDLVAKFCDEIEPSIYSFGIEIGHT